MVYTVNAKGFQDPVKRHSFEQLGILYDNMDHRIAMVAPLSEVMMQFPHFTEAQTRHPKVFAFRAAFFNGVHISPDMLEAVNKAVKTGIVSDLLDLMGAPDDEGNDLAEAMDLPLQPAM